MRTIFKAEFEIDVCESADEFYEKYNNSSYNIILMDISIRGDKHGLELTKEIKLLPLHAQTPIICLTAHAKKKTRKEAIESGSDLFITKPVSIQVLKEAVAFLVNKQKINES